MTINTEQLKLLAQKNPKYAGLFGSLYGVDAQAKQMVRGLFVSMHPNPDACSIKTEISPTEYILNMYDGETNVMVVAVWKLANFLEICAAEMLDKELNESVKNSINKLRDINNSGKTVWN